MVCLCVLSCFLLVFVLVVICFCVACFLSCFALVYLRLRSVFRSCFVLIVMSYFVCLSFLQYCLFSVMFCSRVPTALLSRQVVFRRSRCNVILCLCFAVLLHVFQSCFSLAAIVLPLFLFSFPLRFALIFM